jgi:ribosomal protein S18 acetylase RimI-like enzyme
MSGKPTLRPVDAGDQSFLLALVASTRQDLLLLEHNVSTMLVRMQFEAQLRDYRHRFPAMEESIVLADGVPAGRMYVARSEDELHLVDISLLPEFRSQHIGSTLLAGLQEECTNSGLPLRLHVLQGNSAAGLYRRFGFEPGVVEGIYLSMEWQPTSLKE